MERKVRFSIRVKLIAVTSALVAVSLGLYLFVALGLFNSDKSAYIFESSLNTAESVSTQVNQFITRVLKDSLNIYNLVVDRDLKPDEERFPASFREVFSRSLLTTEEADRIKDKELQKAARLLLKGDERAAERIVMPEASADDDGKIERTDADYLYVKGRMLEASHRVNEALEVFKDFEKRYAKDARIRGVFLALGEIAYLRRSFDEAASYYTKATATKDTVVASYAAYKLAWSYGRLHRFELAARQFAKLLGPQAKLPATVRQYLEGDLVFVFAEAQDLRPVRTALAGVRGSERLLAAVEAEAKRVKTQPNKQDGGTSALESRRILRSLFYGDPDLVEFSVYEKGKDRVHRVLRLVNKDYLSENDLNQDYLDRVDKERKIAFETVKPQKPLLMNSSLRGGMGLISLVRQDPLTSRYLVVRFKLDRFLAIITQNKVYSTYVLSTAGELYAHEDGEKMVAGVNMLQEKFVVDVIKAAQAAGVREYKSKAGDDMILAYSDARVFNLFVFSEIKRKKAFLAAHELTVKSLYFGIFLIAVAMFIGVVFARTLTTPIDKLFRGTRVIAGGDFRTRVEIKSNDEIGVLSDSFNFMAGRIVQLLEQEKDKVRMEEELKVAKLVQDSFFPPTHQTVGGLEISSFYTPSSECGGDWWGLVKSGSRTLILIGDATGHGVPAALITATAASATTTIEAMAKANPEMINSPAKVLEVLNKAVYNAAQGKILMTFFVCVLDTESNRITYSNASHNPPYLYKYTEKEPDKKDLKPLVEAVSLRLGHKSDTTYENATIEVGTGDSLVLFTDGVVECTNPAKEEYGNRKFIKSVLKYAKAETEEMRDGIIGMAMEFYAGQPLADDLTMVCIRVLPRADSAPAAA